MQLTKVTELFSFTENKKTKNYKDEVISFNKLSTREDGYAEFVGKVIDNYVFPVVETIDLCIAIEENVPCLIYGMHGSGKWSLAEQVCIRLNRPYIRQQLTGNTEEMHVVGQWVLEGDKTVFHLGPLARAMKYGLVYIADEYDFAVPNVLSIYQAVLEGGNLLIANAPEELALIKPHADFRFIATGNTNGAGDETGLYQGTQMQNAANYSRFEMTIKLDYSPDESKIIKSKFEGIPEDDLKNLMAFASKIRTAYEQRTITNTVSTRELIAATRWAILRGREKLNWLYGFERAFIRRLQSADAASVTKTLSGIFGT